MSSAKVTASAASIRSVPDVPPEENTSTKPDFIYGGPFITVEKPSPFINAIAPINIPLQGTFKKSFAYFSLKERLPVILTKVIDYLSREGANIKSANGASDEDLQSYIKYISKLKNDLVTNKRYDLLKVDTPEAKKWNEWIESQDILHYFTNTWLFTECYVYRRLREGCELTKGLQNFDPFEEQKNKSFTAALEPMCIVAEKLVEMLPPSEKDKRKADFQTLLKICLWANKCDLSLSAGEQVSLKSKETLTQGSTDSKSKTAQKEPSAQSQPIDGPAIDPFQMIIDYKDKLLVDDTGKAADQIVTKAENIAKAIEANTTFKFQCSCHRLATLYGMPLRSEPAPPAEVGSKTGSPSKGNSASSPLKAVPAPPAEPPEGEEPPKIPCPAKTVVPSAVMYDIVCDNAGYELFADLCFAHFLISQKIVQKVRFHVKKIPWFVSDVTPKDFKFVINACKTASYHREVPAEPKPEPTDGSEPPPADPPRIIKSDPMHGLADQWQQYLDDGTFIVMCDDFWTSPHVYRDMKKYDYNLYRKLQYAVGVMFKGDLNYRKLVGERKCVPTIGLEPSMQGFIPAPILAVRTVKSETVCGLPKGKYEQLEKINEKWMETGDYGVIQFCPKAEPLKVADRPCLDYGETCFGQICPVHTDI